MLRLTVDVNGKVIGTLVIHNRGVLGGEGSEVYHYDAALWDHEDPGRSVLGMEVPYYRPDGWRKLAAMVLAFADRVRENGTLEEVSNV